MEEIQSTSGNDDNSNVNNQVEDIQKIRETIKDM